MDLHSDDMKKEGMWQRFTGKAKSLWGDLTDDDLTKYEGKYDQAMGYLKVRYGEKTDELKHWWESQGDKEKHS